MMLLPIIILIIIFAFFKPSDRGTVNNASDILDRRFANGEISEEDYLKRKSILREK